MTVVVSMGVVIVMVMPMAVDLAARAGMAAVPARVVAVLVGVLGLSHPGIISAQLRRQQCSR